MKVLDNDTESLIKDTAKRIFFKEGKLYATTQDIADVAGINRASIHYYFRSTKQLYDEVFTEAMQELQIKLHAVTLMQLPFRMMVKKFVEFFLERSMESPYLELFIIAELNTDPTIFKTILPTEEYKKRRAQLKTDIDTEVAAGNMKPIKPEQFMINLMSLCTFPFLAQSIIKNAINQTDDAYGMLIKERKAVILDLIFFK